MGESSLPEKAGQSYTVPELIGLLAGKCRENDAQQKDANNTILELRKQFDQFRAEVCEKLSANKEKLQGLGELVGVIEKELGSLRGVVGSRDNLKPEAATSDLEKKLKELENKVATLGQSVEKFGSTREQLKIQLQDAIACLDLRDPK